MRGRSSRFAGFALLVGLAALTGCDKNKNVDPPAELTRFDATARVQKLWSASVGGGEPKLRLGLGVALAGDSVFAAGHDGDVAAFDINTGKRLWSTRTRLPLTGGPGAGEGLVIAGASHGDLVALDAATGAIKWKTRVNSEILSAPTIADGVVALRAVDGRLFLLRQADGSVIWSAEQTVPRLSLRGVSQPAVSSGLAIAGFDNGRVLAVNIADGATAWEIAVAPSSGRSEIERLIDIDSAVHAVGDDVFAVTFQGRVARLTRDTGQIVWARDLSSYRGLTLDEDGVYISTAEGGVFKIGRRTGVEIWKQEVLSRRRLSAPAALGPYVAVADLDGYVHVLDAATGELAARGEVGDRVSAAPVVKGDIAVFFDDEGHLTAFRVVPLEKKSAAPAAAESADAAQPAAPDAPAREPAAE